MNEVDTTNNKGGTVATRTTYQPCRQALLESFYQQKNESNQPTTDQKNAIEHDQERRPILGLQTPSDAQTFGAKPA